MIMPIMPDGTITHLFESFSDPRSVMSPVKTNPQTLSPLLALPAELRNEVYTYFFHDGRAANLDLLLTCRQIHKETAYIAWGQASINIQKLDHGHGLDSFPQRYRDILHSVHGSHDGLLWKDAVVLEEHGLCPTAIVYHSRRNRQLNSAVLLKTFNHQLLTSFRHSLPFPSASNLPGGISRMAMYGQFLINSRLRSVTVPLFTAEELEGHSPKDFGTLQMTREDGNEVDQAVGRTDGEQHHVRLSDDRWLRDLKVKFAAQEFTHEDEEFVVAVSHADSSGLGNVDGLGTPLSVTIRVALRGQNIQPPPPRVSTAKEILQVNLQLLEIRSLKVWNL
jgi:hypothetical protein